MTRTLSLDGMFTPLSIPEIEFNMHHFSGGEWHIKLNPRIDYSTINKVIITQRIHSMDDVMKILIAKDALELMGIRQFELIIPYIPYARQDRQCDSFESFTLKVFTNIINSAKFDVVYVLDPHSDVSPALLDNCKQMQYHEYVSKSFDLIGNPDMVLVSPDSGANKKVNKLFEKIGKFSDIVKCDKVRNPKDGSLSGFLVLSNDLEGKDCFIVDDICDGGRTFIGISEELKKKNAGKIYLFVTHGIFSNGFTELLKHFDGIFTTNSFNDISEEASGYRNSDIKQFKLYL